MNSFTVYMHIAPNNKKYIGVTSNSVSRRFGKDGIGYRTQRLFWRAIQKYGWDNFQHIILAENLSKDDAYDMEIKMIAKYQSNNPEFGYNQSSGGEKSPLGNRHSLSDDVKQRMSESRKGENHPFYGKHHTKSTKTKISESMKGNKNALGAVRSPECRERISKASKGKVVSQETREKLRQRAIAQWKRQKGELDA